MNAIQVYPFVEGALYRLYAAPRSQRHRIAARRNRLDSAGDTTRWVVGDTSSGLGSTKQVHILAKPFAANLRTNLVITTDRRSYHLQLESTDRTYMAAISWTYPQEGLVSTNAGGAPVHTTAADVVPAVENLHFDYAISGDNPPWKPVRAFDDGTHVYIEFPRALDQGDAPPLFVKGNDGNSDLRTIARQLLRRRPALATAELRLGQTISRSFASRTLRTADAATRITRC